MTRIRFEGLRCPALSAPKRSPVGFFCCAADSSPSTVEAEIVESSYKLEEGDSPHRQQETAMPVQRLNHAVLYVRDVERSTAFYRDVLGFRTKLEIPGRAAFLQAEDSTNDHDLGLFAIGSGAAASEAGRRTV